MLRLVMITYVIIGCDYCAITLSISLRKRNRLLIYVTLQIAINLKTFFFF